MKLRIPFSNRKEDNAIQQETRVTPKRRGRRRSTGGAVARRKEHKKDNLTPEQKEALQQLGWYDLSVDDYVVIEQTSKPFNLSEITFDSEIFTKPMKEPNTAEIPKKASSNNVSRMCEQVFSTSLDE